MKNKNFFWRGLASGYMRFSNKNTTLGLRWRGNDAFYTACSGKKGE